MTFIFTEDQLRGYWNKQQSAVDFESLTHQQLMKLAEDMLHHSSHSQLEQHILNHGWRTKDETEGLVLAEDDSREDIHVEIVDTDVPGLASNKLFIDRLTEFTCDQCHFSFYLRELNKENQQLNCPSCGGQVTVK
jgi:DNA-directed RNA polymerase subunit RPC12/RpoP